ncbi:angiopoietin-4 isoform X2 [Scaptodrosophila lebanonensis]|uniref:Angiopoietin-4 isoform X2 n=1 Tax=Drosophila lebanonensis TaxID=7225 RepID=A0A6J2UCA7_DROLE|nr:angiopoietin-4 isoform X2 [Scaptodrosophila lebanonensis]
MGSPHLGSHLVVAIIVAIIVVLCGAQSRAEIGELPTVPPPPPTARRSLGNARASNYRRPQTGPASSHCEYKDLLSNLHDRVGVLATLDEDQRNRLESIDKKINELVESNTARMESIKVQQLDFQKRLDSFEHIQRLSRNTLDELKDLSRNTRAVPEAVPTDATGYPAGIFQRDPELAPAASTSRANTQDLQLDVPQRLDALATLLASTAINVQELQQNVSRIAQNTNIIQRRLHRKGQQGPWAHGYSVAPSQAPGPYYPAQPLATSCLQSYAATLGIIKLQLTPEAEPFYVPCEEDGWTIIMRRSNGKVNFERGWLEYREGFGNLADEFFIGLEKLHALTASTLHELRILLVDFEGNLREARYSTFAIGGEKEHYPLRLLGSFQNSEASAGDSLSYHAGAKFSTFDNDNDNCVQCNCALKHKGGWWYSNCATSNLHGQFTEINYAHAGEPGIFWDTFQGKDYSLHGVKMLIRPLVRDDARR